MNKLESSLKHNLDITMQNSSLMLGRLYKQFGSGMDTSLLIDLNKVIKSLGEMREQLAEVPTEEELNCFANAGENDLGFNDKLIQEHNHERDQFQL